MLATTNFFYLRGYVHILVRGGALASIRLSHNPIFTQLRKTDTVLFTLSYLVKIENLSGLKQLRVKSVAVHSFIIERVFEICMYNIDFDFVTHSIFIL